MSITLQAFSWHFPTFSSGCTQWVIRLQKEPGRWPGSHARTQGILDSAVCSEQPGVALVTQALQLEVSRATHTAQMGQIQSLLSTLSSLSCLHLITGIRPWPAAGHTPRRRAGHTAAPPALLLGPASVDIQGYPSHYSRPHRSTVLSSPIRTKPWEFDVSSYPWSGVSVPVHL